MEHFTRPTPDGEPVYLQIVRRFKQLLVAGKLKDGQEAPSRRALAAQMGVNPMTVQKAFAELERLGLIETPANAKSVIKAGDVAQLRTELFATRIEALIAEAQAAGISKAELVEMVREYTQ